MMQGNLTCVEVRMHLMNTKKIKMLSESHEEPRVIMREVFPEVSVLAKTCTRILWTQDHRTMFDEIRSSLQS